MPIVRRLRRSLRAEQIKGRGAGKRNHAQTVLGGLNVHAPISAAGDTMEVAVIDQNLERETHRGMGAKKLVSYVSGIRALFHPDCFSEKSVTARKSPKGAGPFQA